MSKEDFSKRFNVLEREAIEIRNRLKPAPQIDRNIPIEQILETVQEWNTESDSLLSEYNKKLRELKEFIESQLQQVKSEGE